MVIRQLPVDSLNNAGYTIRKMIEERENEFLINLLKRGVIKQMSMGGCVVSKNIIEGKGKLKWCIREESKIAVDTGWVFLSDIDTDEYLENSDNMKAYNFEDIVNIEPSILSLYNLPIGTEVVLMENQDGKYFIDFETGEEMFKSNLLD